ncbi:MAG: GNAT family N-acetyltransferase [Terriglobia bacterium]
MAVYTVDPLLDPRWPALLAQHPHASIFHTPSWLEALRRTYGYAPIVFTTSAPGEELRNGIVFCCVRSWLTGSRMVSVPFSDHCQPLVEDAGDLNTLLSWLQEELDREKWKYIEIRPLDSACFHLEGPAVFSRSEEFFFHKLDLRPGLDALFHNVCTGSRGKIRRAEREHLGYEEGRSEVFLQKFYRLLLLTRRRHHLPPQPIAWFRNLAHSLGDKLTIRIVSKHGQPIASTLTLFYKNCLVSKYACSDARFHNLGGMPLLLWKAIQEGKELGARELDLGRSETNNPGLVAFKEHLGAVCSKLYYFRAARHASYDSAMPGTVDWRVRLVKRLLTRMPDWVLKAIGSLLYKHAG